MDISLLVFVFSLLESQYICVSHFTPRVFNIYYCPSAVDIMSKISIFVLTGGRWSEAKSYEGFRMYGVLVDENSSYVHLVHTLVDDLSLDLMLYWRLYVKMNSDSTANSIIEIKNDKDALWYLNLVRNVKDCSIPLIVTDVAPDGVDADMAHEQTDNYAVEDGIPYISVFNDVNLSNLPDDYDVQDYMMFGTKFDIQKAITLVAFKNNFQFKILDSSTKKFNVHCVDPNCRWVMKSSSVPGSKVFIIR